jgi:galactokinase
MVLSQLATSLQYRHSMNAAELADRFRNEFQALPRIFSAPGRVNLIGEHTDYNDGFVMPSAIGFSTRVAVSARSDRKLVLRSAEYPEAFEFDLAHLPERLLGAWCDYSLGVATILQQDGGALAGANLLVHGEVPVGAGLSSSAAIEVATALALLSLTDRTLSPPEVAKLCQKAENEFVGARVGIMDQFVACLGKAGHALLLDCRSLDYELVDIPWNVKFVICNTMVKHQLSGGEYNRRREECEQAVHILSRAYPGIKALRDVSLEQLSTLAGTLPAVIYKRCLHVIQENLRVTKAAQYFRSGGLLGVHRLMRESHESLRDLFEVSCRELDIMVEAADSLPGYYGGRMTGGGFGGCTVNLVESSQAESFARDIAERYQRQTGISPEAYICSAANGAGVELNTAAV